MDDEFPAPDDGFPAFFHCVCQAGAA